MGRDLSDLRQDIDDIDNQMHALIRARTKVVEEVRAYKKGAKVKIRPEREAQIMYRLFAQHEGPFPKREMFRMWREMIVATLRFEGPFAVGVYMDDEGSGFWDLARDQYGSYTPMTPHMSTRGVVEAVQKQDVTVGILPLPVPKEEKPWWRRLFFDGPEAPRIIARLPFVPGSNARNNDRQALVICPVAGQPTGRDRTYIGLESNEQLRRSQLDQAFSNIDLPVVFSTDCLDDNRPHVWQTLVEVDGFIAADDPRLKAISDAFDDAITRMVSLGGYAIPLTDAELE